MIHQSKGKITEQAIQVLSRNPQSSMEQVAEKLGISRATLYRHFKTRQMLLKEITLSSYNIFISIIEPILQNDMKAEDKLVKFVRDFVSRGARFYFLTYNDMFLGDKEIEALYKSQSSYLEKLAVQLKADGVLCADISEEWFATSLEFMIYGAWEKIYQGDLAVNKAPELILRTILKGLSDK